MKNAIRIGRTRPDVVVAAGSAGLDSQGRFGAFRHPGGGRNEPWDVQAGRQGLGSAQDPPHLMLSLFLHMLGPRRILFAPARPCFQDRAGHVSRCGISAQTYIRTTTRCVRSAVRISTRWQARSDSLLRDVPAWIRPSTIAVVSSSIEWNSSVSTVPFEHIDRSADVVRFDFDIRAGLCERRRRAQE